MKRLALGACVLTVLAACHEAGPPTSPSMSSPPAVDATARRFTVRNLGTLGGSFSVGVGINERADVVGFADLSSGNLRAFLWRAGTSTMPPSMRCG
jgi:hypothetical protein